MDYQLQNSIAKKYINALRDSRFEQISGKYKNHEPNCFCAIGLFAHANKIPIESDLLIIGINKYIHPDLESRLVDMNDENEYTFSDIADWVEQNVEFI